jgi:hypothetical protein
MRFAIFWVLIASSGWAADKWVAPLEPRPVVPPRSDVHPIDAFLGAPKAPVPDALFARRAYLDLWGLLPTPAQLDAFEKDTAPAKREKLIDELLANKENYSSHWITFWNDLLRNDEGVIYHGERKSITPWLKRALEENLPYDRFVTKLLNPAQAGDPDGFLTGMTWRGVVSASELPPMQAAQNSAQVFLGINLKCNSCHDSFVSTWKLRDAYGLASFFSDGPLELVRCDVKQGKTAETRFLFPELGAVDQGMSLADRRAAAARLFTMPENGRFTRTYVNRIWAQLMGKGIVANVDDMAAKPSNADLLDWLASDFASHSYDSKRLLKLIMTSAAYQATGNEPRRLSAEQFLDSIAEITGEWRVLEDRSTKAGIYAREWRFKSTSLSRALGRPIRDQVTTVRLTQPTTLQALELVNGATLSTLLSRGARRMLGQLPEAPASLFDSGVFRGTKNQPRIDIDVTGRNELWLLMTDVDSYDASRVQGGFVDAEFVRADGSTAKVSEVAALKLPAEVKLDLRGKGYTRFRAKAALDEASTTSDINGTVRFFAFGEKPDMTRLLPAGGPRPVETVALTGLDQQEMVNQLYRFAFARKPDLRELAVAREILGNKATPESMEDLLWALVMSPEFQYLR